MKECCKNCICIDFRCRIRKSGRVVVVCYCGAPKPYKIIKRMLRLEGDVCGFYCEDIDL